MEQPALESGTDAIDTPGSEIVTDQQSHQSFEDALTELESLVDTLEKGELSLEDSLKTFERGVKLTRTCQEALKEAEQKVRMLSQPDEDSDLEPYDRED
jgi:exodeoxyribonuclease VII small subunit